MLMKKTDMAKMVAAAGLILKHENMKAKLISVTASKVMKRWTLANRSHAWMPSNVLMIRSSGKTTKRPPEGKKTLANDALKSPRESTRIREKMAAASHFKRSSRRREMGRHRIILKVPSSASLATMSPPTKET